jgi:hypothetical protein
MVIHRQVKMSRTTSSGASRTGYVAFDLETDGLVVPGTPPPQVTCGVTIKMDRVGAGLFATDTPMRWHEPGALVSGAVMSPEAIARLIDYMWSEHLQGFVPLSWNGLGFDFRVLALHTALFQTEAERCVYGERVRLLALRGADPMFAFFMHRGFPIKLSKCAQGFHTPLNKSGDGVDAIDAWMQGTEATRVGVLNYCECDVGVLVMVASCIDGRGTVVWTTKSDRTMDWKMERGRRGGGPRPPPDPFESCANLVVLPQPDNTWMDVPIKMSQFFDWTLQ